MQSETEGKVFLFVFLGNRKGSDTHTPPPILNLLDFPYLFWMSGKLCTPGQGNHISCFQEWSDHKRVRKDSVLPYRIVWLVRCTNWGKRLWNSCEVSSSCHFTMLESELVGAMLRKFHTITAQSAISIFPVLHYYLHPLASDNTSLSYIEGISVLKRNLDCLVFWLYRR